VIKLLTRTPGTTATGGRAVAGTAVLALAIGLALAGCGTVARTAAAGASQPRTTSAAGRPAASSTHTVTTAASRSAASSGFQVLSMTFVSDNQGWALGSTKCGTHRCLALLGTTDGGTHWNALTAPTKYAGGEYGICPHGKPCAQQVRFMNPDVGYAYDPSLFVTIDGGRTWTRLPGASISSLEGADGTVARVISGSTGCAGQPYHLQSAAVGSDIWHNLNAPKIEMICPPVLYRQGERLVLVGYGNPAGGVRATARIDRSANNGKTWAAGPDKCGGTSGYASDVALAPPNVLMLLCQHQAPMKNGKFGPAYIRTSLNNGATFGPDKVLPAAQAPKGVITKYQVAAGTTRRIFVTETATHGSKLLESQNGGRTWTTALTFRSTTPVILVGFEDPLTARVAQGNTVWTTRNGGKTWTKNTFTS
jgi:hypothetical protein